MAEEQKQEFWRWPESNWKNPELDWSRSTFIAAGIDVGSVSSQAVIVADGEILAYGNMRTGFDSPNSARNAYKFALDAIGMPEERMNYCIGTGYGRVNVSFRQPHPHRDRLPRARGDFHLRPRRAYRAGCRRAGHQVHPVRRKG